MKRIGIWMDKKKAQIMRLHEEEEKFEILFSNLDFLKPTGGSRTRLAKWGPQDVVHDSKYLAKEKQQLKTYFNNLADAIGDADAIALFGPTDTNQKFKKDIERNHKALTKNLKAITKSDSMTKNQVKALVRDYFRHLR